MARPRSKPADTKKLFEQVESGGITFLDRPLTPAEAAAVDQRNMERLIRERARRFGVEPEEAA
jgi:hypothetical protein